MVPKKKRSTDSSKILSFCFRNNYFFEKKIILKLPLPLERVGMRLKRPVYATLIAILLVNIFSACSSDAEVKYEQYVISGAEIYKKNCSNCHGLDGSGLRNLYPPVKGSDYLQDKNKLVCIIKNGLEGPINVAGKTYNQKMPAAKGLYDLDIAQLITFLNGKWGSSKKIVEADEVARVGCE
jgi:mono/diheme cytochrome c family protein